MVIFHAGVKEKPCVYSNIPSTYEEDAQSSVGSQKEDFVPQFKISTWFRTPLFYQVVICQKVFRNGISEICRRELCPICFFKVLFVPDSGNLFILQINLYTWFSSEIFSRDLQVSVQYWECNRQYAFWLKLQSLFKLNKSIQLTQTWEFFSFTLFTASYRQDLGTFTSTFMIHCSKKLNEPLKSRVGFYKTYPFQTGFCHVYSKKYKKIRRLAFESPEYLLSRFNESFRKR